MDTFLKYSIILTILGFFTVGFLFSGKFLLGISTLILFLSPYAFDKIKHFLNKRAIEKEEQKMLDLEKERTKQEKEEDQKIETIIGKNNLVSYLSEFRNNIRLLSNSSEDIKKNNVLIGSIDSTIDNIITDELVNNKILHSETTQDELSDILQSLSDKGFENNPVTIRLKKRLLFNHQK